MSGEAPLIHIKPFLPTAAAYGHYSPTVTVSAGITTQRKSSERERSGVNGANLSSLWDVLPGRYFGISGAPQK